MTARAPWGSTSNNEIQAALLAGEVLSRPEPPSSSEIDKSVLRELYTTMKACWKSNVKARPRFPQLRSDLSERVRTLSEDTAESDSSVDGDAASPVEAGAVNDFYAHHFAPQAATEYSTVIVRRERQFG
jgi:hypothetical protein